MIRRRLYTVALSLVLIGLAVPFCLRSEKKDWDNWYIPAALHLRAGESIYQDGFAFYPPFMTWLAVPFTYAPGLGGKFAFYLVNALAAVVILVMAWRLSGGGRLEGDPPVPLREHVIVALGLLTGIYYALDAFSNQQTDLVIAAVLLVGCGLLVRQRHVWGAVWIGVAAAMKTTPLLFVPYLLWRGWWRSAALVVIVAVGVNVLPDVTHPPTDGVPRLRHWVVEYVVPLARPESVPGVWFTGVNFNHSVAGVGRRLLTTERVRDGDTLAIAPRARVGNTTLKAIVYTICGLLVGLAVVVMRRSSAGQGSAGELGIVLALMPLLSPVSSKPHFVVLLLPGLFLARAAVSRPDVLPRVLLGGAILSGLLSNKDLVGGLVYDTAIWYGSVLWNTMFVLTGGLVVLWRSGNLLSVAAARR